ncbi:MAG: hypothetical protein WCI18_15120 [Pseudomonadota bacterium]
MMTKLKICLFAMILASCGKNKDEQSETAGYYDSNATKYDLAYDVGLASQLSKNATDAANLPRTEPYNPCWGRVWKALKWTFGNQIENLPIGSQYAYDFARWANSNVQGLLQNFKLKKMSVSGSDIPVGSVIVWKPGQCGYSASAGHIEIVVSPGRACSFYCGAICTSAVPEVYVPVKSQTVPEPSLPNVAANSGNSLPPINPSFNPADAYTNQNFNPADAFVTPSPASSGPSISSSASLPAGSTKSPAVVSSPMATGAADPQCKYGRTSLGYCNISPDLNPFALNR